MTQGTRAALIVAALLAAAIIAGVVSLLHGAQPMALGAAWKALVNPAEAGVDGVIVWTLRLPRSIVAYLAGAALAVSGYLLQSITRNPLAAPDLTGVSAGAVAAIVMTFVFLPAVSSVYFALIGMTGGLAAAAVTFYGTQGNRLSPLHLALSGVTVSLFLNALTAYAMLRGAMQSPALLFWLTGGFQGRSWPHLFQMLPWVGCGLAIALASRRVIGMMSLGEDAAHGMGVNVRFWKFLLLAAAVCLVAGVTPVAGSIAFIGLAVPHLVRLLRPPEPLWSVLFNLTGGGCILLVADMLARLVASPREIPIGIITALIGGPVFLVLLQRKPARLPEVEKS